MNRDPAQPALFEFPRDLPQGLLYRPDFLTRDEEEGLIAAIAPLPLREAILWQWQHSLLPTKELRYSVTSRTRA